MACITRPSRSFCSTERILRSQGVRRIAYESRGLQPVLCRGELRLYTLQNGSCLRVPGPEGVVSLKVSFVRTVANWA